MNGIRKQRRRPGDEPPFNDGDDDFLPFDSAEEARRRKEIDDLVDEHIRRDDTKDYAQRRREKSGE